MAEKTQLQLVWAKILERVEPKVSPIAFIAHFKDLQPVEIYHRKIVLKAENSVPADAITHNHAAMFREAIAQADVGLSDFKFIVDGSDKYSYDTEEDSLEAFPPVPINKNYTFSSFVVGASNKFVFAAAKSVAENPGEAFNPLFIYGESGLGKTHLMQAIANYLALHDPEKKVLYTTCEKFLNEFIDSMFSGMNKKSSSRDKSTRFREHYRNVDVLMIDDVQFLTGKSSVQEEFFHTFNELSSQNKQIVLTSDRPPKEIATLEDRLRTRFEGGMIVEIQPPDQETKIAILKRKALDRKCPMPEEVLEYLASDSGHDVRTLEGRLTKVLFASKLHEEPITLQLAKLALQESVRENEDEKEELTLDTIMSAVCGYYKHRKEDILGKSKKADIVKARQVCAYLMCEMLTLPLVSIGKFLGGRDHTTIMYARNKMEDLIKLNEKLAKEVDDIKNIVFKQ